MNRLFLLLFGTATLVAHAQVPDYVPTDGLVAWYPFNGNANDESGNAYHGEINGALLTADRFLEPNSAYSFSGNCQDRIDMLVPEMTENTSFSVSFWAKRNGTGCYNPRMWEFYGGSRTTQCGWFNDWDSITFSGFPIVGADLENEIWYHFALTNTGDTWEAYFNGEFNNLKVDSTVINSPDLAIGRMNHPAWDSFNGEIDDFAIWNRALSAEEVLALYNAQLPVPGCTDSTACNFNEEANEDDGTCTYPPFGLADCEAGGALCGEGTIWDASLQACVGFNNCPSDLDGDGIVGVNDLLSLLSDFGTECPPEVAEWTCGDPVSYHGYDYATVQIGEQCWFAENLRSENYDNGEAIPAGLSNSEWTSTTLGATAVYGEGAGCNNYSPDIDACDPAQSLSEYGRYYNWYAVDDARGLCPSGWHVPTDGEWTVMTDVLGGEFVAGGQMKSTYGWHNGGNGTNSSGFSGLSGGSRNGNTGGSVYAGLNGNWWSSSPSDSSAWFRYLIDSSEDVGRLDDNPRLGFSVRCVRDAE